MHHILFFFQINLPDLYYLFVLQNLFRIIDWVCKQKPRARSGGSPGATPRNAGQSASTTAADLREPSAGEPENTNPARQVKIEASEAAAETTREPGRACRRARGEKSPSGDWTGLPGYMGPARPRAKSMGRKGPRTLPREERGQSTGRNGPRIRPRDDGVGAHPAETPPGSRPRMSFHAVGWFLNNMHRAFASMDAQELNRVSETLNTEMDQREGAEPECPRGRSQSRVGRDRSRPPPGGRANRGGRERARLESSPPLKSSDEKTCAVAI